MTKIKYYQPKKLASGDVAHGINPPGYIRKALGASYRQFPTIGQAADYSDELQKAYAAFKASDKPVKVLSSSFRGICDSYLVSTRFAKLAEESKRSYRQYIEILCTTTLPSSGRQFGTLPASTVSAIDADALYAQIADDHGDYRAFHAMKVARRVFNVAGRKGTVKTNPFSRMKLDTPESRKVMWEAQHVAAAIAQCDHTGLHGLGTLILLCYHLCQRPGDMRQLKLSNVEGNTVSFTQEKTGTDMVLTLTPQIMDRLRRFHLGRNDPDNTLVLNDRTRQPFDRRNYNEYFNTVRRDAKLPEMLWIADLRRTGATETAAAGATEDELRAITGHQSRVMLNTYIQASKNQKLANNGMSKRFDDEDDDTT